MFERHFRVPGKRCHGHAGHDGHGGAYRESAVASIISPYLANADKEKRMVVKQIIQAIAGVIPDYENNILNVVLYSLSASRYNHAASELAKLLAKLLNQTETKFPGTDLRTVFKISAN